MEEPTIGGARPTLWVAVVGAGPAGYYTAEALAKQRDDIHIDILDRLPTPFGLIRGGVAPDHQSIKNVYRRYEKTNLADNVRFVGNLSVGADVSLDTLLELYDAVVLATGAPDDRALSIPGEDKTGVIGSAAFVAYLSSLCNLAFTATQYALLSSLMAFGRTVLAASSGWFAEQLGWPGFFLATTLLAVPGLVLLWYLARLYPVRARPDVAESVPERAG